MHARVEWEALRSVCLRRGHRAWQWMPFRMLGVDVGIINLAIAELEEDEIIDFRVVDITVLRHTTTCRKECTLFHGNSLTDRVLHFLQEEEGRFRCRCCRC